MESYENTPRSLPLPGKSPKPWSLILVIPRILLTRIEIPQAEINHVSLNSKLLFSRSRSAPMFCLPQVDPNVPECALAIPVQHGECGKSTADIESTFHISLM
jgi:hypothetical protein